MAADGSVDEPVGDYQIPDAALVPQRDYLLILHAELNRIILAPESVVGRQVTARVC